jgi:hypothetical protein
MPEAKERASHRQIGRRVLWGIIAPLVAVTGSLAVLALIYFGYDVVKARMSPCEAIFRQSSLGLSTRIKLLKAEGELQIGPETVADLDERAQMMALDLKTCCTVLDAGRIDPEQFLQCKAKARSFDAHIENVAALLSQKNSGIAGAASDAPAALPALQTAIEAARSDSRDLNQQVVQIGKEQALQSLQGVPPSHVSIDATELEPNDDILHANVIELGKRVKAAISTPKDSDFYTFTTPAVYRDWIRIELQNQSTTLEPNLELFDAAKTSVGSVHNATPGGDLTYEFVALPSSTFTVRVSNYYGQSTGVYLIQVAAEKAYDAYEPNDDILSAKRIGGGVAVKAKIMDKDDVDFFSVEGTDKNESPLSVTIANNSSSLHPNVVIYDSSKAEIGSAHNSTAGGDLSYTLNVPKGPVYVRVSDYYAQSGGDYTLTIASQR